MSQHHHYTKAIQSVINLCRERWGFRSEILRQLRLLGHDVSRQMLHRWLHSDASRRIHPGFGTGMLLLQAVALAEVEWKRKPISKYMAKKKVQSIQPPNQNAP